MRHLLVLLMFALPIFANGQNFTTQRSLVGSCTFSAFSAGGTADVQGDLINFLDQTNYNFATNIQVDDVVWDNLGNRWRVAAINSASLLEANVDLEDVNGAGGTPLGAGFVSRETSHGLSLFVPDNNIGISQQLKSTVEAHNAIRINQELDTLFNLITSGNRDTIYQIATVPDTSTLSPLQGNIFSNTAKDTLGFYAGAASGGWVVVAVGGVGGGSQTLSLSGDSLSISGGNTVVLTGQTVNVENYGALGDGATDDYDAFESAIAAAGDNGTIQLTGGKTYLVCHTINMRTGQTLIGNGATIKRCDQSTTALAEDVSIAEDTVTLTTVPSAWAVGDFVRIYTGNTEALGSNLRRITEILGSDIIVDSPTAIASDWGDTYSTGDSIMKSYHQVFSDYNSVSSEQARVINIRFDGNKANNVVNLGWSVNRCIGFFGRGSIIRDCEFFDMPNECIISHGVNVTGNTFKRLNGSAFHLSAYDPFEAAQTPSFFTNNVVDSVCQVSFSTNGHNEGAVTVSWNGGELLIADNWMRNGGNSIYGPLRTDTAGTDNVLIHGNLFKNFSSILYAVDAPSGSPVDSVENIIITNNVFDNCGTNDFSSDALPYWESFKVGNNVLSGGTTFNFFGPNELHEFGGEIRTVFATSTVNFYNKLHKITQIEMGGAITSRTLLFSNPADFGRYSFHFTGVTTDTLEFPSTVYHIDESTQLGTRIISENKWVDMYYYDGNYYADDTLGVSLSTATQTEYQAVLDYATNNSYTLPPDSVQTLQNQIVADLKANNRWDSLEVFYVFQGAGDSLFAGINWIDTSQFEITPNGGVTWDAATGYTGDGATGYLDTGYNPSIDSTINNSFYGSGFAYVSTYTGANSTNIWGGRTGTFATTTNHTLLTINNSSTGFQAGMNHKSNNSSTTYPSAANSSSGYFMVAKNGTNQIAYKDGSSVSTKAITAGSTVTTVNLYILAFNNDGSPTGYDDNSVGVVFWGGDTSATAATLKTIIENYINSL